MGNLFPYLLCAGKGSKMLCKQSYTYICGSLRVGKKRGAFMCMRNSALLALKIGILLLGGNLLYFCPSSPLADVYFICDNFV